MSTHLIAVHAIVVSDPNVTMVATGAWNADGSPIMRKASRTIPPGALFPITDLDDGETGAMWLLGNEAARWPTEAELLSIGKD